jgi:hypothetical protein
MYQRPLDCGELARLLAVTVQMALPFCATIAFSISYVLAFCRCNVILSGSH